jgi:hypothetical protein
MERFLQWITRFLPSNELDRPGTTERYMTRYYVLRTRWLGIYIHRFWSSDPDGFHDHPWAAVTRVLHGNYIEWFLDGSFAIQSPRSGWRFMSARTFHRVMLNPKLSGRTWTLFVRFKRRRLWGFVSENTYWREAPGAREKLACKD